MKKDNWRKQVEKRLIDLDMTKNKLAKLIGVTPQNLNNILRGYYPNWEKWRGTIREALDGYEKNREIIDGDPT